MNLLLVILCGAVACCSNTGIRLFQTKLQKTPRQLQLYQALYMLLAAVSYLLITGFSMPKSVYGWLLSAGFALCLGMSSIGTAESMLCGPMSLSGVIISCNVVLPIAVGWIFFREPVSAVHIIGCALLLGVFLLSGGDAKSEKKEVSPRWYLMVLLAFIANGFGAVAVSMYAKVSGDDNGLLGISFLLAALMLFGYVLWGRKQASLDVKTLLKRPLFYILVAVSALAVFGVNRILLFLNGRLPASVLYPVYNGVTSVLLCMVSWAVFREPMNKKKILTIVLGIGAVILLNL